MSDQGTGVLGNTEGRRASSTTSRTERKQQKISLGWNIGLVATILLTAVILAQSNVGFVWTLIIGSGLIAIGAKTDGKKIPGLAESVVNWPMIIRTLGWAIVVVTILNSAFGQIAIQKVQEIETGIRCEHLESCEDYREAQEADTARDLATRIAAAEANALVAAAAYVPPPIFPAVDQFGCTGQYAMQVNCKRVTLHASAGDSIDWVVDKSTDSRSRCIQFNPSNRLQTSLLRNESDEPVGTTFTFTGNGQMTYTIFEVPVGQTGPGGARCGS